MARSDEIGLRTPVIQSTFLPKSSVPQDYLYIVAGIIEGSLPYTLGCRWNIDSPTSHCQRNSRRACSGYLFLAATESTVDYYSTWWNIDFCIPIQFIVKDWIAAARGSRSRIYICKCRQPVCVWLGSRRIVYYK